MENEKGTKEKMSRGLGHQAGGNEKVPLSCRSVVPSTVTLCRAGPKA